jgi:hypothetical protein
MMGQLDPPKLGLEEWKSHPYKETLLRHLRAEHAQMLENLFGAAFSSTDPAIAREAGQIMEHRRLIQFLERKEKDGPE